MLAENAAHRRPDGGVTGDPGVAVSVVVVGDGGEAGLQSALADAGHQAGEPGGDQDCVDRQGSGIGALGAAPGGETEASREGVGRRWVAGARDSPAKVAAVSTAAASGPASTARRVSGSRAARARRRATAKGFARIGRRRLRPEGG